MPPNLADTINWRNGSELNVCILALKVIGMGHAPYQDLPKEVKEICKEASERLDAALRGQGEPVAFAETMLYQTRNANTFSVEVVFKTEDQAHDFLDSLYAAHPQGEWVSVPREPTEAMYEAGMVFLLKRGTAWDVKELYRAMLSAAPDGSQSQKERK